MKRKLKWAAVAFSLSLNVFFVLGFLHSRNVQRKMQSAEGRAALMAQALKLNAEQRREFEAANAEMSQCLRQLFEPHASNANAFWLTATDPQANQATVEKAIAPLCALQQQMMIAAVPYVQRMTKVLTPQQREEFVQMMCKNQGQKF